MTPTIAIIIATVLLTAYVLCMVAVGGVPKSLSQSVFYLPAGGRWLWTVIIGAVAALTMPVLLGHVHPDTQFIAFFACGALGFVAVTPLVHDKQDISYKVHMTAAYTCGVLSQLLVSLNEPWLLLIWTFWTFDFIIYRIRRHEWDTAKFWAEMTCFITIFVLCFAMTSTVLGY